MKYSSEDREILHKLLDRMIDEEESYYRYESAQMMYYPNRIKGEIPMPLIKRKRFFLSIKKEEDFL